MTRLGSVGTPWLRQMDTRSNSGSMRRGVAGISCAFKRVIQTVGLAAIALPAMASREVESLKIVPMILGALAGMVGQMLLAMTVIAIVLTPLLIWIGRHAGTLGQPSANRSRSRVASLRQSGERRPDSAHEVGDDQVRQAQLRAQAEAIDLRPQVRTTFDVDDDTRKRIAAAVKRLQTHHAETGSQKKEQGQFPDQQAEEALVRESDADTVPEPFVRGDRDRGGGTPGE